MRAMNRFDPLHPLDLLHPPCLPQQAHAAGRRPAAPAAAMAAWPWGVRAVALLAVLACSACGNLPQAWEKDVLARPDMAFDASPLEARFADHLHASKEASSGGAAAAGAGCGCN